MDTINAYAKTLDTIREIEKVGIDVKIKPSRSRKDKDTIAKYSGPERIDPSKWNHVTFTVSNKEQSELIFQKCTELRKLGIGFDTGGCSGQRDWELDWSFKYTGKPDNDEEPRRTIVENLLNA